MRMGADDGIHAVFLQKGLDLGLGLANGVVKLAAPVDHCYDEIRAGGIYIFHHLGNAFGVHLLIGAVVVLIKEIDTALATGRKGHAVHTLGKCHKGNANALHLHQGIALFLFGFVRVAVSAQRNQTGMLYSIDGRYKSGNATGNGAGIGKLQNIHTGGRQRFGETGGGAAAFAAVRLSVEIAFKIQHGQIGVAQQRQNIHKSVLEAAVTACAVYHIVCYIQITACGKVNDGLICAVGV